MHTNIDYAIASVIERGQELNVSNVFAAYFQGIATCGAADDVSPVDMDTIARAALFSFERAMDKYPIPTGPAKTRIQAATQAKTKATSTSTPKSPTSTAAPAKTKKYSVEVAQLRWDYQQAILRTATSIVDYNPQCICLSCSMLSLRDQATLLAEKVEDLEQQLINLPVPKSRARKLKRPVAKKTQFDPYAPSTSATAI